MKRKRIVKFQLVLFFVVAVLLVWRVARGPVAPSGLVTMTGIETGHLESAAFRLDTEARVMVDVVGSLEDEGSDVRAAYGWILSRSDRQVVWEQRPERSEISRTLMTTKDSLDLLAGDYEVYFASYGPEFDSRSGRSILGLRPHWTNDAKHWRLVVSPEQEESGAAISIDQGAEIPDSFWSTGTMRNREIRKFRFQVTAPSEMHVYAISELCGTECDRARLTDLAEARDVWTMTQENTEPAGGADRNRRFDGTVSLAPGLYEAVVQTDRQHGAGAWRANPPYDPAGWGMRMDLQSGEARAYDPWSVREPIVSFLRVGNDADLEAALEVKQRVSVVIVATGEVGSGDTVYDYAWLERIGDGSKVWKMSVDNTEPAGGDRTNRVETAILTLDPDRYLLRYVSDGSHSFGDWRREEPSHPARWGVAMFGLSAQASDSTAVRVESRSSRAAVESAVSAPPPPPAVLPSSADLLYEATSLPNESTREFTLNLEQASKVRIVAIGEISDGGRYDYGWIEKATGETVWEMTRRNTVSAGGNDINRMFDGIVALEPGEYTVHFKTDFSHAYGDFGGGPPNDAQGYGIRIYRLGN